MECKSRLQESRDLTVKPLIKGLDGATKVGFGTKGDRPNALDMFHGVPCMNA